MNDPNLAAYEVKAVDAWPVDTPLTDAFVIAAGTVDVARCLFVRLELAGGAVGYGEIAPLTALTGEDRDAGLAVVDALRDAVVGANALRFRAVSEAMQLAAPDQPAVRSGLETALLDATARSAGLPMWAWWGGGRVEPVETDVTIPILPIDRSLALADHWVGNGFRVLKLKIGTDLDQDLARLEALATRWPDVVFTLDANQGFTVEQALEALRRLAPWADRVRMFEQPVAAADVEGLAAVRRASVVPVAADEAVATVADAQRVIAAGAADIINLKITKSGVLEALAIAQLARSAGLRMSIGGMVETRLAMGCSLAIVLGTGWIDFVDLDTPLLMQGDPLRAGYRYEGPRMIPTDAAGLGIEPVSTPA